jgi:hypothetical protein
MRKITPTRKNIKRMTRRLAGRAHIQISAARQVFRSKATLLRNLELVRDAWKICPEDGTNKDQPHERLSVGNDVYVVYRYGEPVFTWTEAHSIGRFGDIKQWAGALLETQIDPTHRLN